MTRIQDPYKFNDESEVHWEQGEEAFWHFVNNTTTREQAERQFPGQDPRWAYLRAYTLLRRLEDLGLVMRVAQGRKWALTQEGINIMEEMEELEPETQLPDPNEQRGPLDFD